jgi:hypothetical protein
MTTHIATIQLDISTKLEETGTKILVLFTHDNKLSAIESPAFNAADKWERRSALDATMEIMALVVRQRLWPNDTKLHDTANGPFGKRFVNPRYPDEE